MTSATLDWFPKLHVCPAVVVVRVSSCSAASPTSARDPGWPWSDRATFESSLLLRAVLRYLDCFLISQVPEVARVAAGNPAGCNRSMQPPSVTCLLYFIRCSGCSYSRHLLECTNCVAAIGDGSLTRLIDDGRRRHVVA